MLRRWCIPFVTVVLVGLVPQGAAEPAQLDLDLALPVRLAGDVTWSPDGATLLAQSARGHLEWYLEAHRLTLVEVELWEHVTDGAAPSWSPAAGVRTTEHTWTDASVAVIARDAGFTALAWGTDQHATGAAMGAPPVPADDPAWWSQADVRVFRLAAPMEVTAGFTSDSGMMGRVLGRPVPFTHEVAAGRLHVQAADAAHALTGAIDLYLAGGEITVQHHDGRLALTLAEILEERPGSVYVPGEGWAGPGTHKERIMRYVQARADDATLSVVTRDVPAALYAAAVPFTLAGHLGAADATGMLRLEDAGDVTPDGETFVTSGRMAGVLTPGGADDRARLAGEGDVAYVRTGGSSASYAMDGVAGTAAGLVLVVGLAALAWKIKGAGLGVLLFSRVARSKALDHGARSEIYAMVKENPGLSAHEVVERLRLGWSTVTYHLGVLERTELIIAHKEGRHRRYFDRTSGQYANGRKKIVSVLKNETTAKIAAAVRDRPGLVQRRLAEEFGLAPSSVNWHIKRLVDAGLVVKERAARAVALLPGPGWEKLDAIGPA